MATVLEFDARFPNESAAARVITRVGYDQDGWRIVPDGNDYRLALLVYQDAVRVIKSIRRFHPALTFRVRQIDERDI